MTGFAILMSCWELEQGRPEEAGLPRPCLAPPPIPASPLSPFSPISREAAGTWRAEATQTPIPGSADHSACDHGQIPFPSWTSVPSSAQCGFGLSNPQTATHYDSSSSSAIFSPSLGKSNTPRASGSEWAKRGPQPLLASWGW